MVFKNNQKLAMNGQEQRRNISSIISNCIMQLLIENHTLFGTTVRVLVQLKRMSSPEQNMKNNAEKAKENIPLDLLLIVFLNELI